MKPSRGGLFRPHSHPMRAISSLCAFLVLAVTAAGQTTIRHHESASQGERFGGAVSSLGDVNGDGFVDYGVVALAGESGAGSGGVVYVYSGWEGGSLRVHTGGQGAQEFGLSLGTVGDLDGDSVDDYAIGDPASMIEGAALGRVYLYSGATGTELGSYQGYSALSRFGEALASLGDVNGNSVPDFVIGVPGDDAAGSSAGAVQVMDGESSSPIWSAQGADSGNRFGASLAPMEDVNGDGVRDLIVGSPLADGLGGVNCGVVQILSGSDGTVLLNTGGLADGDQFGTSVCGLGDWDGDGLSDFAVGASQADGSGSASGTVSVHSSADGAVLFSMSGTASGDNLGEAIANAGDVNWDGAIDLIVGIPGEDGGAPNTGAIVVLSGNDGAVLVDFIGTRAFGRLGSSVAGLGRVDYDQYSDFAFGTDGASIVSGEAWVLSEHINDPPALVDDDITTEEDTPVVFNPLDNDSDHDGWVVISSLQILSAPSNGIIDIDSSTSEITYTPDLNWYGDEIFTYAISDDDGAVGTVATISIHVLDVNDPPVAIDDFVSTDEDVSMVIDVLSNDSDVDGVIVATSVVIESSASNGSVSVDPVTGEVSYSPDPDWFGVDGFSYSMSDDDGDASNVATCTVTVNEVNDLPVAQDDAITTFQKFPTPVDVLANDSDVDGTLDASGIVIVSGPANGTAVVDLGQNAVVYLGGISFFGVDSFTYLATDDDGGESNVVTVTVTVLEDCNHNQVWDTEDITNGTSQDCNLTGIPDDCELEGNDCNGNGVPDECETDCNGNGRPDDCDLALTAHSDCDANGVPDDCQADCNGNGSPDDCDLALAVSMDCDMDGLPDECANVRWVDAAASDCNGDGSWAAPHCSIQDAIDAAFWNETVLVMPGTYYENVRFAGRGVLVKAATYAGPATTIIDAGGAGTAVKFQANETSSCVLQGFTITGGVGNAGSAGGVAVSGASPTIRGCWIVGNTASGGGGGASTRNQAQPSFYDCVFEGNDSDGSGGGMMIDGGSIKLRRCHFVNNTAADDGGGLFGRNMSQGTLELCSFEGNSATTGEGGGLFLDGVGWTVDDCEFIGNDCATDGGGISARNANQIPRFISCVVSGNSAGQNGGGLSFDAVIVDVSDSTVRANQAAARGGGLYAVNSPVLELEGNELSNNTAGTFGGGLFVSAQGGSIERCTSSGNAAGIGGGGAYLLEYSSPKLDSCVLWGDSPDEVRVEITPTINGGVVSGVNYPDAVQYSCVQGGWPLGTGNVATDPLFRDAAEGDYALLPGSPCVDTGNPGLAADPDGSRADMGAHPYQGAEVLDVLTWNFGGDGGLEPVISTSDPLSLITAATNRWNDYRDRGFLERIHRLADIVVEEDPDVLFVQGLVTAGVSPVGDVLSGASTGTNDVVFDQYQALMDRLNFMGWGHLSSYREDYHLEVPVITCDGYADVSLRAVTVGITREPNIASGDFGTFTEQLSGPLGGLGPVSTSLGWVGMTMPNGGPTVTTTRLESSPSAGLQPAQAAELAMSLSGTTVLVGDFASTPGSPAYNTFAGLSFEDAWTPFGSGSGATCCQAENLMNLGSMLSERVDWGLSNDVLWRAKAASVIGDRVSDRSVSGRWTSTHAGLLTRWATP